MMNVRDRYHNDQYFRHLVDSLYIAIEAAQYTPTEIREAAMLAQIMYEESHPRPIFWTMMDHDNQIREKLGIAPHNVDAKRAIEQLDNLRRQSDGTDGVTSPRG